MRVVREYTHEPMKVAIFSWNEKYMVKIEYGPYEQWYKFRHEDISADDIVILLDEEFFSEASERFQAMHRSLKGAYGRKKA